MDFREKTCTEKLAQLPGVPTIGLDAIPRPTGDEGRSDDPAPNPRGFQLSLQAETAGPRLVAAKDLAFRA